MAGGSTPAQKAEQTVKYVGSADVREISAQAWKNAGVEEQNKVVWDRKNNHTVKASELSAGALEILAKDPGFKISEA